MSVAVNTIIASYTPILRPQTPNTFQSLTNAAFPSFPKECLAQLCSEARCQFSQQPSLLELDDMTITIVGDLHGSLFDLLRILKDGHMLDDENSKFLFLGDYVDRGSFSVEVVTLLFALALQYPTRVFLLRGNHEFDSVCSKYGFSDEVENVYGDLVVYHDFVTTFSYLPLAAVINGMHLCVHGGISERLRSLADLRGIMRPIIDCDSRPLVRDIMWADLKSSLCYYVESTRVDNMLDFGYKAVRDFLHANNLRSLIRAHQYHNKGVHTEIGIVHTVFSASSYKAGDSNPSGVLIHEYGGVLKKRLYEAWDRPERNSLQFFNVRMKKTVLRSESMRGTMVQTFQKILTQSLRERKRTIGYNCGINTGCSRFIRPSQSGSLDDKRLTQTFCCGHESLP